YGRIVRVPLLRRPHGGGIRFVVPHGVSHEGIHEHIGLVHVAHHALAGGDRTGEAVLERMSGLLLVDGWVDGLRLPLIAELRIGPGMLRIAVIGVYDMAAGATGAA